MEHAAVGLCKMLSLGHADFTLNLFDDSASLPEKQLKRQRSVNDRPVPPQSRLLYITLRHFLLWCAHGRSSWSWPPLEKEQRETSRISSWTLTRFLEEGDVQVRKPTRLPRVLA